MSTFLWSLLSNGQLINPVNPDVDVLRFDDVTISAANVLVSSNDTLTSSIVSYGGKTVTFQMNPWATTTTNITFDNGSMLLIGDNTTGTVSDDAANTLTGGSGNDLLIGLSGNDSLNGGSGNDVFEMFAGTTGTWGNDTITGGSGVDRIRFGAGAVGINVNFSVGYTDANGIQGTITGGDGSPGSTVSTFGVEQVTGTPWNDTFTASSLTPVRSLLSDVSQLFDGGSGNDIINGATGNGRNTTISYQSALSGVTVNLATGIASGGSSTGTDTFNNIDGIQGSQFNDTLTGGSNSNSITAGLFEFFEGMAGNDTINGGSGSDRVQYNNSPAAVNVNLALGTAQDGWGGTDTLISIEQARGSAFNDTLTGGNFNDVFEGLGGNDTISGAGGSDEIRYQGATAAVSVNLATGVAQALSGDAGIGIDSFTSIEQVRGSDFNDLLVGGGMGEGPDRNFVEWFEGRAGNDTIDGGTTNAGIDVTSYLTAPGGAIVNFSSAAILVNAPVAGGQLTLVTVQPGTAYDGFGSVSGGPIGTDTLIRINAAKGSSFNDTFVGGSNNEYFEGRQGNDNINGGGGTDAVFYRESPAGVNVNFATGTAADGWGTTDTLSNVENVRGSNFADTLTGDGNANLFYGGPGNDIINGAGGVDTIFFYGESPGSVNVNLATGMASDGLGGTDTVSGIENIVGSAFNDTLTGDGNANVLDGAPGTDTLIGGAGNDIYMVDNPGDVVTENAGEGTDEVRSTIDYTLGANVENLTLVGLLGNTLTFATTEGQFSMSRAVSGTNALIGGWYVNEGAPNNHNRAALTFLSDGTFFFAQDGNPAFDPTGQDGMERGTYTWNPATGAFTRSMITDTNGQWGLSHGNIATIQVNGDQMTVTDSVDGPFTFTRTADLNNPLVGGWYINSGGPNNHDRAALTFLSDGTYFFAQDGNPAFDPTGQDGMERGTYTWNPATNAFTHITLTDTNGQWGLSHSQINSLQVVVSGTGNALDNVITGNAANNILNGGAGNDTLNGGAGNDTLIGGPDVDTALFSGARSAYTITHSGATTTASGPEGTDTLTGIERLQFSDVIIPTANQVPVIDFNGDGNSDILWRNTDGTIASWTMNGSSSTYATLATNVPLSWTIIDSHGDYNGDGKSDVLWRNTDGTIASWTMNGSSTTYNTLATNVPVSWSIIDGHGDYNGDGKSDVLWRNTDGTIASWTMNGSSTTYNTLATNVPVSWSIIDGHGDYNGDGKSDILWRNTDGTIASWTMNGSSYTYNTLATNVTASWSIIDGHGDYNGDGKSDVLWRNTDGTIASWTMNGSSATYNTLATNVPVSWSIIDSHGDYNGDGKSDVLWRNTDGTIASWTMNGSSTTYNTLATNVPVSWSIIEGHSDYNGDGKSDVLWRNTDGTIASWTMDGSSTTYHTLATNVPTSWNMIDVIELGGSIGGDAGNNVLQGTLGRDQLSGGLGSDSLTGGMGADRFVYNSVNEGLDTITDFTKGSGGDVLDIHNVLVGYQPGISNTNDFVHLTEGGGNTTVSVDANGKTSGNNFVNLAVLQGVTGLLLNDLLAQGNLAVA